MADIRCSHCGKNNPDFFDVCQFCQSPLKSESMLHIGDEPTKMDTGELEGILPDWLKDAREQGKNEAADDPFRSQTQPKVPKEEPPDLLAGLMSQADSDEDEVPDWLASINPIQEKEPSPKPSSTEEDDSSDFFAQFRQPEAQVPPRAENETVQEDVPASMGMDEKPSEQKDELTDWFPQASAEPDEAVSLNDVSEPASDEGNWMKNIESFDAPAQESPAEKEPEDLSWLHDLESASKGTGDLPAPQQDAGFDFAPSSSGEDMSWLDNLGGTPTSAFEEPAPTQPPSSDDDLDWLNKLGDTPAPAFEESAPTQPPSSREDLDWLKNLGGTSTSVPAFEGSEPSQPSSSQEDLDWFNDLAGTSEPETSFTAFTDQDEPQTSGTHADTSSQPFRTAPLNELRRDNEVTDTTPDWLKSAMEEPSMPPPGAVSMDWFAEHDKHTDAESEEQDVPTQQEEPFDQTQGEPASPQSAFDFSSEDSSTSAAQDVDSLFDVEMPDWLSQESEVTEASQVGATSAPVDESLAPVELPSWVQAMRPVDSAISETPPGGTDQVTESEGPLAGFRGVIPASPIGSSLRPKAFSLKLHVTEEQQAGASLLEQIIASETTVQSRKSAGIVSSQRILRWSLSGLFLIVLGIVIGLGLQTMPIYASAAVNELSNLVTGIPDSSPVLVVIDYEPSFSGEMEAAAGPLLDQLALTRRSTFTFISMSPNGFALVDRLMFNTKVSRPAPDGLGYQLNTQYFNLGFLPGGSAGVLGFIEDPKDEFSKFSAVVLMTDNAETGRVWVEQLDFAKGKYPQIGGKPLFVVSSAQSGPMLQPYVSSGQVDVMISGLYDAAKYELVNVSRPGNARAYWDAFGLGLIIAVFAIILGSVWSVLVQFREQRAEAEQG
ncbi:MAG TPA: hypothetical protein VIS72_01615 [Anaerolineales bacterium]